MQVVGQNLFSMSVYYIAMNMLFNLWLEFIICLFVWVYDITNFVCYLMPNSFLYK